MSDSSEDEDFVPSEEEEEKESEPQISEEERQRQAAEEQARKAAAQKDIDDLWAKLQAGRSTTKSTAPSSSSSSLSSLSSSSSSCSSCSSSSSLSSTQTKPSPTQQTMSEERKRLMAEAMGLLSKVKSATSADDQEKHEAEQKEPEARGENSHAGQTFSAGKRKRSETGESDDEKKDQSVNATTIASTPSSALDELAATMGGKKKKKVTTLQRSKQDWQRFKTTEGKQYEHELEQNIKSGGYLAKQAFLQEADLRQYEREKQLRKKKPSSITPNIK